jgi:hypothetical protein
MADRVVHEDVDALIGNICLTRLLLLGNRIRIIVLLIAIHAVIVVVECRLLIIICISSYRPFELILVFLDFFEFLLRPILNDFENSFSLF